MFRCRRNTAVRLCPIYKMYFNHTIEPLQHVKQAHWLPCIISCFKFRVTKPDPNPSIISKYLSEPDPAPSGTVGFRRAPSGLGQVSNKELFSGRDVWNTTFIHVPIGDSVSDREVYSSMPHIPAIFIRLDLAAPFYPGSAIVQPIKPGCAEQTSSSRACSIILDFFILVLCNTPKLFWVFAMLFRLA